MRRCSGNADFSALRTRIHRATPHRPSSGILDSAPRRPLGRVFTAAAVRGRKGMKRTIMSIEPGAENDPREPAYPTDQPMSPPPYAPPAGPQAQPSVPVPYAPPPPYAPASGAFDNAGFAPPTQYPSGMTPQQGHMMIVPKNPALGVILSFFIPGLGSIVNGSVGRGGVIMGCFFVAVLFILLLIGIPFAIGLWIWGMVDGYQSAQRWNQAHGIVS